MDFLIDSILGLTFHLFIVALLEPNADEAFFSKCNEAFYFLAWALMDFLLLEVDFFESLFLTRRVNPLDYRF